METKPVKRPRGSKGIGNADTALVEERVNELVEEICSGNRGRKLLLKYSELWGISERQVHTYLSKAHAKMKEAITDSREQLLANVTRRISWLADRACQIEDLGNARLAFMDLSKLLGLHEDRAHLTVDHNSKELLEELDVKELREKVQS